MHALTTNTDPEALHANVKNILAQYLAAGIDPDKAAIFVQSDIPEIPEMYLLLNMHVGVGELMRTTSFKDKARKALGLAAPGSDASTMTKEEDEAFEHQLFGGDSNKRVSAGLLTYPTLMAVDILIQKAKYVPVGKDQEQHLELTRRFARRFNSFYGVEEFIEPQNFDFGGKPIKVPGLDGSGKMGKSEGNCIYLIDDPKTLRKKVMRAVTDEGPKEPNSQMCEPIANLISLLELASTPEVVQKYRDAYADCSIRYGDLKKNLPKTLRVSPSLYASASTHTSTMKRTCVRFWLAVPNAHANALPRPWPKYAKLWVCEASDHSSATRPSSTTRHVKEYFSQII